MKLANLAGRLVIVTASGAVDVERLSGGAFGPDPQSVYDRWEAFSDWATTGEPAPAGPYDLKDLCAPAPQPRQVFAVGFNYRAHAREFGTPVSDAGLPPVFTKYVSSIAGPYDDLSIPDGSVDWEVELVAVIGRRARHVDEGDAWAYVAGLTVGQDISERGAQLRGPTPQFSLGKSCPGFAPMGPWLVTPDELPDPDDLRLTCTLNGEVVQDARTSQLITPIRRLVAELSKVLPLLPGDVLFTGTPAGVGMGRTPKRYLRPGDELVSAVEGIGAMRQRITAAVPPGPTTSVQKGHLS